MRKELFTWVVAAALTIAVGVSSARAESSEEMVAAAKALDKAFIEAFNSGNAEAASALYWNSPDAVSFPPDVMIARGIDGIRKAYVGAMKSMAGGKLELTESHYIPLKDAVVTWGLWRFTMPVEGGAPVEMLGRYTDVKAKRDGKWVYLVDHASAPMPSEPPAAAPQK